ncbi:MAG: hypothetical protein N5P05_003408 [Chroococcopsis gigantea SAG 12.99]|jgi:glycosyltransferase involved in cell wall biosynthesis|nr:glycosyltransferase [Chlorogloea purpurea SAG 13.99]MDV3001802.1 hypothetical protein [Chroococcopsis gigantea SAG 12.99]
MLEPEIAGIICTHNRDYYLGAAIDSLLNQTCKNYEIIVVDNGCTDDTKTVVSARLAHSRLKYVYEPTLGLSTARNRGMQETQAPILAYLDDDAEASPGWLQTLLEAYNHNDKLAVAGGKVSLIWPEGHGQPYWMSDDLAGALGLFDLGDDVVYINSPNLTPRGLNYSIRRDFLESVGGFDTNLGRVGKKLLSNEELYMTEQALKKGWQVAYIPTALVAHNVSLERLEKQWFYRRSWWQGISEHYREEVGGRTGIGQLGRGGERFIRGIYKSLKNINNPARSFDNLLYAYGQIGYLTGVVKHLLKTKQ